MKSTKAIENPFGVNFVKCSGVISHNGKNVKYGYYFEGNKKVHYVMYFVDGKDCAVQTMTKTTIANRAIAKINEFLNA